MARSRPRARTATTVSRSIGRKIPTRSPGADAERSAAARPRRRPPPSSSALVSRRTAPSSPSQASASPSGSRATAWLDRGPRVVERAADPPARPRRPAAGVEDPRPGRRCQASPRSSAAAPQNQPGSATARAWSASSDRLAGRRAGTARGATRRPAPGPVATQRRGHPARRSASLAPSPQGNGSLVPGRRGGGLAPDLPSVLMRPGTERGRPRGPAPSPLDRRDRYAAAPSNSGWPLVASIPGSRTRPRSASAAIAPTATTTAPTWSAGIVPST